MISDKELRQHVLDELEFEPGVDAAHIGIAARDGVVTLTGRVTSYTEKLAAEAAARRVKGVRGIAEEIEVHLPSDKKRGDDEIAERALKILDWVSVAAERITVRVEKGILTLAGEVDWRHERTQAESAVRRLTGVVGVINQIRLRPQPNSADVKDEIVKAFRRSGELEASSIDVAVADGRVTLTGRARDWTELDTAERAAWCVPGVTEVIDEIEVGP